MRAVHLGSRRVFTDLAQYYHELRPGSLRALCSESSLRELAWRLSDEPLCLQLFLYTGSTCSTLKEGMLADKLALDSVLHQGRC